jgi:hypothetical protein
MNYSQWFHEQLQAGADGFVWSAGQIPTARLYEQPPKALGKWSAARHVFHMLYYEKTVALPSMEQWLGGIVPPYDDADEDRAWADNQKNMEALLNQFRGVRAEQIALLPKFDPAAWISTREALWGPVTLLWVVSKTFQHTAEHTNDVMQESASNCSMHNGRTMSERRPARWLISKDDHVACTIEIRIVLTL